MEGLVSLWLCVVSRSLSALVLLSMNLVFLKWNNTNKKSKQVFFVVFFVCFLGFFLVCFPFMKPICLHEEDTLQKEPWCKENESLVFFSSVYHFFGECLKKGVKGECHLIDMKYPIPSIACLSVCMLHIRSSTAHCGTTLLGCLIQNGVNLSFQGEPVLFPKGLRTKLHLCFHKSQTCKGFSL